MKKLILMLAVLGLSSLALVGCRASGEIDTALAVPMIR